MRPQNAQCILLFELLLLLLCSYQNRAHVPAIILFGDSTVDTGNNNYIKTMARSNFWPYGRDFYGRKPTGRFCNGRLSMDFISEAFKLPPIIPAFLDHHYTVKHFASGVCFASAATGYDNATAKLNSVIPLSQQLEYYKQYQEMLRRYQGDVRAQETIREAIHIISLGTNDFMVSYYGIGSRSSEFTIEQYMDFIIGLTEGFIRDIYRLGARKLEVIELAPFGCLPLLRWRSGDQRGQCKEKFNKVARDYNHKLKALADKLNNELPAIKIVFANLYDLFSDVIRNPTSYGFENSVRGCCGTGLFEAGTTCNVLVPTCRNANKHVFWDAAHPSERMHQILADHILKTALHVFL